MRPPAFLTKIILPFLLLSASSYGLYAQEQGGEAPPPPAVNIVVATPQSVPVVTELPGRVAPTRVAEVRPRISGIVVERVFTQGSTVKEGEVLYRIDPMPFRVRVASAEASLARAKAVELNAKQLAERQSQLREREVTSTTNYDNAVAALAQAEADVALAQASLDAAKLDLGYTEVRAPISGRIGRALVTEGALVSPSDANHLALVQQLDPVYVDFTQSSNAVRELRRSLDAGDLESPAPGEASVQLVFDDGTPYSEKGRLLFSEASVDSTTGQITLRAEFPNPKDELLAGLYVRVRIEQAVDSSAILVPQRAIIRDNSGGAQVYVVDEMNIAHLRNITLGQAIDNNWIVRTGIKSGDKVIIDGGAKVQDGTSVAISQ
ncbi:MULTISPECIES: efflux RND transporter periplasmic adaptor subunit [unclassified Bartonella]|uniref:efflux RND transporter periplasmic adaptor subunit n=1 Tax=unclassified Bartonella TaxID=2645622 RepID=UPI0021C61CAD|nr:MULTISPECIES: efflux RND transporter periplasmic adaptor subunit [unclassified Bartonella]UXN02646.1 efflux RND transporter periplasmic adaptor subunit [Bartonella sp. HY406]UXN05607.1 efflux RND transporter periplasmic adaptor subunit [Bartonella sp. HY761]